MRTFEIHLSMYSRKEGDPIYIELFEGGVHRHDLQEAEARAMFEKARKVLQKEEEG